ncbi:MAG: MBL fold metallo-hydrolase [Gammaproteobacteria bacterium]|nr:MBL fold metallo-hydrolase [Gammaproteobacteria bacterium]
MKSKLVAIGILSIAFIHAAAAALNVDDSIAARKWVFGAEFVDPQSGKLPSDKVIFSWLSASTFAVSLQGRVFLLDSYVTRLEVEHGRTPLVLKDLVNLDPEAILLGHGHNDHADHAAYISAMTDAVIYATEETCGTMQADFERMAADPRIQNYPERAFPDDADVECVPVTTKGSIPGTEVLKLAFLEPQACVTAFRHLHSIAVEPDPDFPPTPVEIIVDERDETLFPRGTLLWPSSRKLVVEPADSRQFNTTTTRGAPGGAEPLFFSFLLRDGSNFSFAYQNTAGALKEGIGRNYAGTPKDGQRIIDILESLAPTDVHLGTAATGNFDNNGLRDLIMYQAAIKPKIYIPNHLTTGSRAKEGSSLSVYAGYLNQMDLMGVPNEDRPRLHWLVDPVDYIKPFVFDIGQPSWADPAKAVALKGYCSPGGSTRPERISLH